MNQVSSVALQRVVPAENVRRRYSISVGWDLFGGAIVTCAWGRIGHPGQTRTLPCPTLADAQELATKLVTARQRRGYGSRAHAAAAASVSAARATNPRRPRAAARRRATGRVSKNEHQLPLFDLTGAPAIARAPTARLLSPPPPSVEPQAQEAPLMRLLNKPATAHERERQIAAIASDPRLRGLVRRGRDLAEVEPRRNQGAKVRTSALPSNRNLDLRMTAYEREQRIETACAFDPKLTPALRHGRTHALTRK